MAFEIILYTNSAEPERVDKTAFLSNPISFIGTLREGTNLLQPSFLINMAGVPSSNYAYISEFSRYYYITDIVAETTNLWRFNLSCDVLMSFKDQIGMNRAIIARQEYGGDPHMVDDRLPAWSEPEILYLPTVKGNNPFNTEDDAGGENHLIITSNGGIPALTPSGGSGIPSPFNGANGYYVTNHRVAQDLINKVWAESAINQQTQYLYDNLGEAIVSIQAFPFDLRDINTTFTDTAAVMKIGNITVTPSQGLGDLYYLTEGYKAVLDVASFTLPRKYQDFRDYAPYTQATIYLPFIGYTDIDMDLCVGHTVNIRYIVDLDTGRCTAALYRTINGEAAMIMTRDGMCSVHIPLSNNGADSRDAANILAYQQANANLAYDIATAPVESFLAPASKKTMVKGIAGDVAGAMLEAGRSMIPIMFNQHRTVMSAGSSTPFNSFYLPLEPFIIMRRVVSVVPQDYAHYVGVPSMDEGLLINMAGYTEVATVHLENMSPATLPEVQEIEARLKEGVIL